VGLVCGVTARGVEVAVCGCGIGLIYGLAARGVAVRGCAVGLVCGLGGMEMGMVVPVAGVLVSRVRVRMIAVGGVMRQVTRAEDPNPGFGIAAARRAHRFRPPSLPRPT
jgi:hypothetical protein